MIGRYRGNDMYLAPGDEWRYLDGTLVSSDPNRQCGHCNLPNRDDGHDACLGVIPGAINACCGHGNPDEAYVQYEMP